MKAFLMGAAVGYVLGAKAGRGRYEQIMRTYRRIADHPAVQGAAGIASTTASAEAMASPIIRARWSVQATRPTIAARFATRSTIRPRRS